MEKPVCFAEIFNHGLLVWLVKCASHPGLLVRLCDVCMACRTGLGINVSGVCGRCDLACRLPVPEEPARACGHEDDCANRSRPRARRPPTFGFPNRPAHERRRCEEEIDPMLSPYRRRTRLSDEKGCCDLCNVNCISDDDCSASLIEDAVELPFTYPYFCDSVRATGLRTENGD